MSRLQLKYSLRTVLTKSTTKRVRREGGIPATVYGRGEESKSIVVGKEDISGLLKTPGGRLSVIDIKEDRVTYWIEQGAQPSSTVRSLLRRKGLLLRLHLKKKGLSEEEIALEVEKWEQLQEERRKKQDVRTRK